MFKNNGSLVFRVQLTNKTNGEPITSGASYEFGAGDSAYAAGTGSIGHLSDGTWLVTPATAELNASEADGFFSIKVSATDAIPEVLNVPLYDDSFATTITSIDGKVDTINTNTASNKTVLDNGVTLADDELADAIQATNDESQAIQGILNNGTYGLAALQTLIAALPDADAINTAINGGADSPYDPRPVPDKYVRLSEPNDNASMLSSKEIRVAADATLRFGVDFSKDATTYLNYVQSVTVSNTTGDATAWSVTQWNSRPGAVWGSIAKVTLGDRTAGDTADVTVVAVDAAGIEVSETVSLIIE